MQYKGVAQDKAIMISLGIIREPYAWPGGYERIAITDDGAIICHDCVKSELRHIANGYKLIVRVDIVDYLHKYASEKQLEKIAKFLGIETGEAK